MDILTQLRGLFPGVDMALVAGIIVLLLAVRWADKQRGKKSTKAKELGKGAYVLMSIGLGFVAAAIVVGNPGTGFLGWLLSWLRSGIQHAAVASILYQIGKTVIPGADRYWVRRPK